MGILYFNGIAHTIDDGSLGSLFGTMMRMINKGRSGVIFTHTLSEVIFTHTLSDTISWYVHPGVLLHAVYDTPISSDNEQVIRGHFTTDDEGNPTPTWPTR